MGGLTLKEYDLLLKRKIQQDNRILYNAGVVAAAVINMARDPEKSEPISPVDFVPDWAKLKQKPEDVPGETQLAAVLSVLGNRVVQKKKGT